MDNKAETLMWQRLVALENKTKDNSSQEEKIKKLESQTVLLQKEVEELQSDSDKQYHLCASRHDDLVDKITERNNKTLWQRMFSR